MLARCPSCGAQVEDEADVCPACGWDFIKRERRAGHEAPSPRPPSASKPPPPPAPKPAAPAKPAPDLPKLPPAKGPPDAVGDAGRGLMHFPKIERGSKKEGGPSAENPFAIPQFSRPQPPPAPAEPPAKKEEKRAEPLKQGTPPPAKKLEPTPLAAELEDAPPPEPPRTAMRKSEAPAPAKGKEPAKRPEPPRKPASGAPLKTGPMGAYIGLASVAVVAISGAGIYFLTRAGEPRPRPSSSTTERPFARGSSGGAPSPPGEAAPEPPASEPLQPPPIKPKPRPAEPVKPPEAPTRPPAKAKPAEPPPAAKPEPPKPAAPAWTFEGNVYDLINLKPVAGAKMVFHAGGKDFACETDGKGRFKISLAPLAAGSYSLGISQKAYLDGYVDETSPPLDELEADERRAIAVSNSRNDPWIGDVKKPVKRDCYVIPSNLGEAAQ